MSATVDKVDDLQGLVVSWIVSGRRAKFGHAQPAQTSQQHVASPDVGVERAGAFADCFTGVCTPISVSSEPGLANVGDSDYQVARYSAPMTL